MKFETKEQLLKQIKADDACSEGRKWCEKQSCLDDILKNCCSSLRVWALRLDYEQFAEHCDWSKLRGFDWCWLLIEKPQFSEHCDWSKLNCFDWSLLLQKQPQFKKYKVLYLI